MKCSVVSESKLLKSAQVTGDWFSKQFKELNKNELNTEDVSQAMHNILLA